MSKTSGSASDPYAILGLKHSATEAEIKQAYRKLARQWHPDQFQNPSEKQKAEAQIKRINIAYSQLKDPNFTPDSSASRSDAGATRTSNNSVKKDNSAQRQARAQSYYRQAKTLEQAERFQDATKALTLAINLVPNYAEAYQYRAYLYDLRGFEFLAKKDIARAKTLGLEKAYQQSPKADPAPPKTTASKTKRWRPKGWGESSRPKAAKSAPKTTAPKTTTPKRPANPAPPSPSQPATPPKTAASPTADLFTHPTAMAAVNQNWTCTTTLKSRAGGITQLLPYGSTNGISASTNGTIQLWNFERGYDFADLKGHSAPVLDLDLNADGQILTSASQDGTIKLWHLSSATLTRSFATGIITSLIFSPDRHTISCCNTSGEIRQWNSSQESPSPQISTTPWADRATTYLGLSNNRKLLITRSPDNQLQRYLIDQPDQPPRNLTSSKLQHTAIALSPSNRHIATGDRTGLIRLWNLQTAEPIMAIQGQPGIIQAIAFTPDNRLIASLCKTENNQTLIQIWSRPSREHLCDITPPNNSDRFTSLCFTGDSKRLITGTETGEIQTWQPTARTQ